jgi:hypothetical protein
MSSYANLDLFGSGPHTFHVHGLTQRHVEHTQPGVDGSMITTLGTSARSIDQTGTLVADDLAGLQSQIDAIEAAMNGQGSEVVDHLGRSWARMVLLVFEPGEIRRVGPRLAVDYTLRYAQVNA